MIYKTILQYSCPFWWGSQIFTFTVQEMDLIMWSIYQVVACISKGYVRKWLFFIKESWHLEAVLDLLWFMIGCTLFVELLWSWIEPFVRVQCKLHMLAREELLVGIFTWNMMTRIGSLIGPNASYTYWWGKNYNGLYTAYDNMSRTIRESGNRTSMFKHPNEFRKTGYMCKLVILQQGGIMHGSVKNLPCVLTVNAAINIICGKVESLPCMIYSISQKNEGIIYGLNWGTAMVTL